MIFTELIFIYFFLPLVTFISFFGKSNVFKNLVIIGSSLVFFTWGSPLWCSAIFLSAVITYILVLIVDNKESKILSIIALIVSVLFNASLLVGINYLIFNNGWTANITPLAKIVQSVLTPLGISLYFFRGISYSIDVFKKDIPSEKNPLDFLVYMMSYHLIFVGPFIKYGDMADRIKERRILSSDVSQGISTFILGLGQVVIFSNLFLNLSKIGLDTKFPSFYGSLIGVLFFAMGFYFVLNGYSYMAVGLGKINGLYYPDNFPEPKPFGNVTSLVRSFNRPLIKCFDEYIIKPISKFGRVSIIFFTLLSGGFIGAIYGLKINIIMFGFYFALVCLAESLFLNKILLKVPFVLRILYTFIITFGGWCIYVLDSVKDVKIFVKSILFMGERPEYIYRDFYDGIIKNVFIICIGFVLFLPTRHLSSSYIQKLMDKNNLWYNIIRISQIVLNVLILGVSTVLIADIF